MFKHLSIGAKCWPDLNQRGRIECDTMTRFLCMPSLEIKKYKSIPSHSKRGLACSPIIPHNSNNVVVFQMKFEFNDLALKTMKNALHGRPFSASWGKLIFDEIKVKKDLAFDKGTLEHHGIVNFGKAVRAKIEKGLGDHVPVFKFRPYKAKWVQPFACFASKEAASGSILLI